MIVPFLFMFPPFAVSGLFPASKPFYHTPIQKTSGFVVLALSRPSAIVLGVVGALAPEHLLVRLADQLS